MRAPAGSPRTSSVTWPTSRSRRARRRDRTGCGSSAPEAPRRLATATAFAGLLVAATVVSRRAGVVEPMPSRVRAIGAEAEAVRIAGPRAAGRRAPASGRHARCGPGPARPDRERGERRARLDLPRPRPPRRAEGGQAAAGHPRRSAGSGRRSSATAGRSAIRLTQAKLMEALGRTQNNYWASPEAGATAARRGPSGAREGRPRPRPHRHAQQPQEPRRGLQGSRAGRRGDPADRGDGPTDGRRARP